MNKKIALVILISLSLLVTACGKKQETNTTTVPNKTQIATEPNYSKYSGSWVTETNLRDDFKYGIMTEVTIDKDGNIKGVVSDCSENAAHVSNVDIKGKIQDDKFTYNFDEDGWEHSGNIKLDFKDDKIVLTIKYPSISSGVVSTFAELEIASAANTASTCIVF